MKLNKIAVGIACIIFSMESIAGVAKLTIHGWAILFDMKDLKITLTIPLTIYKNVA